MIRVYACSVRRLFEESQRDPGWLSSLPVESRNRIQRLRRESDQMRSLAGEFLSRRVLASHTGLPVERLRIQRDPFRKPYLPGSGLHFNLSHSADRLVLAVGSTRVGVDVEKIRPVPELNQVASRFLSERECRELGRCRDALRRYRFFQYWTLKESFIKALGRGLTLDLRGFSVILLEQGRASIEPTPTDFDAARWELRTYRLGEGYLASVCAEDQEPSVAIEWIEGRP